MTRRARITRAKTRHAPVRLAARATRRAKRAPVRSKAATQEIIGQPPPPVRVPSKWRAHYQRLTDLRSMMLRRKDNLTRAAQEEKPNFSLHMADAGTDNYDQDFALSMISSEQDALYEIEQAIKRIQDGTYGICEMTGKSIERERLQAIPWARFSADAEKQLEREGAVARTRLGQREEIAKTEPPAADAEEEEGE